MFDRRPLETFKPRIVTGTNSEHLEAAIGELRLGVRDFPDSIEKLPQIQLHARLVVVAVIRSSRLDIDFSVDTTSIFENRPDFMPFIAEEFAALLDRMHGSQGVEDPYDKISPSLSVIDVLEAARSVAAAASYGFSLGERAEAKLNSAADQFTLHEDQEVQEAAYGLLQQIRERES